MNIEKIEIKHNMYVWVDKEAEISSYCLANGITYSNSIVKYMPSPCPSPYVSNKSILTKIIAASPELNLEGVPSYVEWLAEQNIIDVNSKVHKDLERDGWIKLGFIKGYQARDKDLQDDKFYGRACSRMQTKVKSMFTDDDVMKAIELARVQYIAYTGGDYEFEYCPEEIINQLKKKKTNE